MIALQFRCGMEQKAGAFFLLDELSIRSSLGCVFGWQDIMMLMGRSLMKGMRIMDDDWKDSLS